MPKIPRIKPIHVLGYLAVGGAVLLWSKSRWAQGQASWGGIGTSAATVYPSLIVGWPYAAAINLGLNNVLKMPGVSHGLVLDE